MPAVILFVLLAVLTVLLVKAVLDAREQMPAPPRHRDGHRQALPQPPARRIPGPRRAALDEDGLSEHVTKLGSAVREQLITMDEAIDSVVRQSGGRVSAHTAHDLLKR